MAGRFQRSSDDRRRVASEDELSAEELAIQRAEAIPDRAALSILSANVTIPLDPSVAADVLSGMAGDDAGGSEEPPGEGAGEGRAPDSDG